MRESICKVRTHCIMCRTDAAARQQWLDIGWVKERDFECPHGITAATAEAVQAEALAKLPGYDPEAAAKRKAEIEAQGRAAWAWLDAESRAGTLTKERLKTEFWPMIPRYGCGCVKEADELLIKIPFREDDQYQWRVDFQNGVNAKLGKPLWSY